MRVAILHALPKRVEIKTISEHEDELEFPQRAGGGYIEICNGTLKEHGLYLFPLQFFCSDGEGFMRGTEKHFFGILGPIVVSRGGNDGETVDLTDDDVEWLNATFGR